MLIYILCDGIVLQTFLLCLNKVALHLSVEPVAHGLHHDVTVAIYAWTLPLLYQLLEDILHIGHVIVSAKAKVLGFPVITT